MELTQTGNACDIMTNYAILFDLHNISALQGRVNLCVSFAGGAPPPGRRSTDAGKRAWQATGGRRRQSPGAPGLRS